MAKNEGTVTIPIDRYLELTKFVEDVSAKETMYIYRFDGADHYVVLTKDEFTTSIQEKNKLLEKDNDDFARHNDALQKRIADFNSKSWYQRVFKSHV